jgi:hypothetical protein
VPSTDLEVESMVIHQAFDRKSLSSVYLLIFNEYQCLIYCHPQIPVATRNLPSVTYVDESSRHSALLSLCGKGATPLRRLAHRMDGRGYAGSHGYGCVSFGHERASGKFTAQSSSV